MHHYTEIEMDIVQEIVESSGSIYHPVSKRDFLGIHAIIEIIVAEIPINQSFGVHIVNAEEYFNPDGGNYKIACEKHINYFKDYSLPVVIIAIDIKANDGFWSVFDSSKINNDTIIINKTVESRFNFKSFNTTIIDCFINGEKRLFLVESFLKEKENQELKTFLEALFKVFDISIPYVLKFEFLDELIEAAGFSLEVSDKSILDIGKERKINGSSRIGGTHYYFVTFLSDEENIICCSPIMIVHLGERYELVQKKCS